MNVKIVFPGNRSALKYLLTILLVAVLLFCSCNKKHHKVSRGFYFWKTSFALGTYEKQRLVDAGCTHIYLHCFDVDWDAATRQPTPIGTLRVSQKPDTDFHYIPVVFITQHTIEQLRPQQIRELAQHIARLLETTCAETGIEPEELQIDCDWTQRTKGVYFGLLVALRKMTFFKDKKLSCTIRLHQVKYSLRSGIPPVDRGLIMCYNIGNLKQSGAHNSILDASLAEDYLRNLKSYPLPVDVGLPLYSWCLHFREGKLQGILRDVAPEDVMSNALFQNSKKNLYTCVRDTVWQGYHFLTGDELRVESPSQEALEQVAHFTSDAIRNDSLRVLFFHIDSLTLTKYSTHDLEAVYGAYH